MGIYFINITSDCSSVLCDLFFLLPKLFQFWQFIAYSGCVLCSIGSHHFLGALPYFLALPHASGSHCIFHPTPHFFLADIFNHVFYFFKVSFFFSINLWSFAKSDCAVSCFNCFPLTVTCFFTCLVIFFVLLFSCQVVSDSLQPYGL